MMQQNISMQVSMELRRPLQTMVTTKSPYKTIAKSLVTHYLPHTSVDARSSNCTISATLEADISHDLKWPERNFSSWEPCRISPRLQGLDKSTKQAQKPFSFLPQIVHPPQRKKNIYCIVKDGARFVLGRLQAYLALLRPQYFSRKILQIAGQRS
jgi:hypothetical protein